MTLAPAGWRASTPRADLRAKPKPFPTETSPCPRALVSPSLLRASSRRARTKEAEGLRRVATRCAPTLRVGAAGALRTRWRRRNAKASISPLREILLAHQRASSATSSKDTARPSSRRISSTPQNASSAMCSACAASIAGRSFRRARGARIPIHPPTIHPPGSAGAFVRPSRVALALSPRRARANAPCQGPISKDPPGARRTCAFARRVVGRTGRDRERRRRVVGVAGDVCHPHARGGVVRRRSRARVRHARAEHPRTLEVRQARRQAARHSLSTLREWHEHAAPEDAARRHSPVPCRGGETRRDVSGAIRR